MKSELYIKKYLILQKEALADINIGAYNKAVSALWFSMEFVLRGLLLSERKTPPERAGKLISLAFRTIFRDLENSLRLSRLLLSLYCRRREIDHRKKIADREYALDTLAKYREALRIISKKYPIVKQNPSVY